jgi:hypothetical protein
LRIAEACQAKVMPGSEMRLDGAAGEQDVAFDGQMCDLIRTILGYSLMELIPLIGFAWAG